MGAIGVAKALTGSMYKHTSTYLLGGVKGLKAGSLQGARLPSAMICDIECAKRLYTNLWLSCDIPYVTDALL